MSETLSGGLTLIIPSAGDTNWQTLIKTSCFQKISDHDHTGSGKGGQIATGAIANGAVTTAKLGSLSITDAQLATDSVITAKILDLNVTTAKLAANAVTGAKIRLENGVSLRTRNVANSADLSVLLTTTSNVLSLAPGVADQSTIIYGGGGTAALLVLAGESNSTTPGRVDLVGGSAAGDVIVGGRSATGVLNFHTNATARFQITAAGMMIPVVTNSYDIGASSQEVRNIVVRNIGTYSASDIRFYTGGTNQWKLTASDGSIRPETDNSLNIGAAGAAVSRTYTNRMQMSADTAPASPTAGSWVLYADAGDSNKLKAKYSSGTVVTLGTP